MGIPWIKITTNIFDDEKIKIIDAMPENDAILVIWIKLLTLAGKCNSSGCLMITDSMPYTEEMLASIFHRPLAVIRLALDAFERLEMIERHDAIMLVNWEKHQNEAALATIREHEKERKCIQRNKMKLLSRTSPGQVPEMSHDVRILDIDKEEDIDKENQEDKKADKPPSAPRSSTLLKPRLEEVVQFFEDSKYKQDPEEFFNYWESTGWKRSNGRSIVDWKATARNYVKKPWAPLAPPKPAKKQLCPKCGTQLFDGGCRNLACPECPLHEEP